MFLAAVSFMVMGPSTSPTTPGCLLPWPVPQPGKGRGSSWTIRSRQLLGDPETFCLKDDTPWDSRLLYNGCGPAPSLTRSPGACLTPQGPSSGSQTGRKRILFCVLFSLSFWWFPSQFTAGSDEPWGGTEMRRQKHSRRWGYGSAGSDSLKLPGNQRFLFGLTLRRLQLLSLGLEEDEAGIV